MAQAHGRETAARVKHVFFTGFMFAGKTLAARALARLRGLKFADTDLEVKKSSGLAPDAFIRKRGLAAFRKAERAALAKLAACGRPSAIGLGGGLYPSPSRASFFRRHGAVVFLDCPREELARRLAAVGGRPLLRAATPAAAEKKLAALLKRRLPYYRRADITVNTARLTPRATAVRTAKELEKHGLFHF